MAGFGAVNVLASVLYALLWIYFLLLIFRLIMEFVFQFSRSYEPRGAMLVVLETTYTLTDPPLRLVRRFLPPLRIGGVSLDLSFLVVIIVINILLGLVDNLAVSG
jgi:YggT family protein